MKGKKKRRKKIKKKNHSKYYKSLTYSEQKEYLEDREYLKYVRLQLTIFVFISIVTAIFGLLIFFLAYFSMDADQQRLHWNAIDFSAFPWKLIQQF